MESIHQFHQRFMCTFFIQNFGAKNYQSQNTALLFLMPKFCTKNVCITLMTLTAGWKFTKLQKKVSKDFCNFRPLKSWSFWEEVFKVEVLQSWLLITVKIINNLFAMKNYSIKACQSYKKVTNLLWDVLWILNQDSKWLLFNRHV